MVQPRDLSRDTDFNSQIALKCLNTLIDKGGWEILAPETAELRMALQALFFSEFRGDTHLFHDILDRKANPRFKCDPNRHFYRPNWKAFLRILITQPAREPKDFLLVSPPA